MRKYPAHVDDIISKERIEKGRTHIVIACNNYAKQINEAFFDGFMAAHCETPEEYEAITAEDRIAFLFAALERCAILRRETPPRLDFIGGHSSPNSLQDVTAHCSGREGGLKW